MEKISDAVPVNAADLARDFINAAAWVDVSNNSPADRNALRELEMKAIREWGFRCNRFMSPEKIARLQLISDCTGEHAVYFRAGDNRAVKITKPGYYGRVPAPLTDKFESVEASAADYLRRMALQIAVFKSDIKLEGLCVTRKHSAVGDFPVDGISFVISQKWFVRSAAPHPVELALVLRKKGFSFVPESHYGWLREEDGVAIIDAKPENFIRTEKGLHPIDLQMRQFNRGEIANIRLIRSPWAR